MNQSPDSLTAKQADEIAALKVAHRREDARLAEAGRAREVLDKNISALGFDPNGERPRLLSINGVRFRALI